MWILLAVLLNNLIFINTISNDRLIGDNICLKVVTEPIETVHHYEMKNRTIRTYKWCMNIPPRCSQYEMKVINEPITKEMNISRSIEVCCEGYERVGNTCQSLCYKCKNGACFDGTCTCYDGWIGKFCDTLNSTIINEKLTINDDDDDLIWAYHDVDDTWDNENFREWGSEEETWNPNSKHFMENNAEFPFEILNVTSTTASTIATVTTIRHHQTSTDPPAVTSTTTMKNSVYKNGNNEIEQKTKNFSQNVVPAESTSTITPSTTDRIYNETDISTTEHYPLDTTVTESIVLRSTTPLIRIAHEKIGNSPLYEGNNKVDDFNDNSYDTDYREIGGESIEITSPLPLNFSDKEITKNHEQTTIKTHEISSESYDQNTISDLIPKERESSTTIKNNQNNNKHLFYIISIILFVIVVILVVIAAVYLLQNGKKRSKIDSNKGNTIGYTSSIFHTPLPDPPVSTFDNPTYMSITEPMNWTRSSNSQAKAIQEFTLTFQKPINQNSSFRKSQDCKSYLYDHPPSTGSYRASSEVDTLSQYNTSTTRSLSSSHMEPLYHEIPSSPEYSVPKRNIVNGNKRNLHESVYMNTTCSTKF